MKAYVYRESMGLLEQRIAAATGITIHSVVAVYPQELRVLVDELLGDEAKAALDSTMTDRQMTFVEVEDVVA